MQRYEKEEEEMLEKRYSPLRKHTKPINQSSHRVVFIIYPYHNLTKPAQSNTGTVTHFSVVLWFPGSLWS